MHTIERLAGALALFALALPGAALAGGAKAGGARDGVDAWSRGDYAAAVADWKAPAAAGDADAQYNLAQAYKLGRGVKPDLKRAEALYRAAAMQGHMRAADAYGLLLFQQGRREEALPWLSAAADRGEPRAQYVLGIAAYNGDLAPRDWVRAYALMTRAAGAGLPQATKSLAEMDSTIPLDQRQQGIALAGELAKKADALRGSQIAAEELGTPRTAAGAVPTPAPGRIASVALPPSAAPRAEAGLTPVPTPRPAPSNTVRAGADFANPVVLSSRERRASSKVTVHSNAVPAGVVPPPAEAAPPPSTKSPSAKPAPAASASGEWRVQLGAFGDSANANALWTKVKGRPELAGKTRFEVPAGKVHRLQAGGFASEGDASRACDALKAGGFACLPVRP